MFDASDDTWKKLMSGVSKWNAVSKTNRPSYIFELCKMLAAKNEDFACQVYPRLCHKGTENEAEKQYNNEPMDVLR